MTARLNCAGLSDMGRRRTNNEDRFHADPERGIFFVIDGVGGQAAGEKAAETAYHLMRARLERQTGTPADRIREAITLANNEIFRLADENEEWHGMACVLTVAVVQDEEVTIGQVGDSRLYLIRPGEIRKLTRDHSPVGEREDRGEIDEVTAMRHPRRNEVYRDVGTQHHAPEDPGFIDLDTAAFPADGMLLLCSDGLSDLVTSAEILTIVEQHAGNPQLAASALAAAANDAGGKDNITVVLVEGPRFAQGVRRRMSVPRTTVPLDRPRRAFMPVLFVLLGMALAAGAWSWLKPHWVQGKGIAFGPVIEPRTWRVTSDLENAVEIARPGDTIIVAPGTYNETIRLRDGVRLISEQPRKAVIRANSVAVFAEDVEGARIEGFTIRSNETMFLQTGIQVLRSSIDIVDNEIAETLQAGIELRESPNVLIVGNTIKPRARMAIDLAGLEGPRIVGNTFITAADDVAILTGGKPVVHGNVFQSRFPLVAPPGVNVEELLRNNFVLPVQTPPKPRTTPPQQNAPARVR